MQLLCSNTFFLIISSLSKFYSPWKLFQVIAVTAKILPRFRHFFVEYYTWRNKAFSIKTTISFVLLDTWRSHGGINGAALSSWNEIIMMLKPSLVLSLLLLFDHCKGLSFLSFVPILLNFTFSNILPVDWRFKAFVSF